ncbi:DUF6268 family outer membrane beta-barrel protein [Arenibacter sp. GZD96]|uniref:DUF6268 family outer membrane beta-barrel protein n=1 Tax=Aurantibrevibacter litoralis TaxID=3106030 RepID=UPI002AFFA24B|nr:DUF6268 family outer membrane beta-barrel protein [Arenibacter sp. GZD-96]MEA1787047.1 DUF6268 family outer membrane beta-barrel protein [Arenibacter sp. GZD-96]
MKRGIAVLILSVFALVSCFGQSPDIFRIEYMTMPRNASDVGITRVKVLGNLPLKGKSEHFFVVGFDYSGISYDIGREVPFDDRALDALHIIDINVAYVYKWNADWRFIGVITPRMASDFSVGWRNDNLNLNMTFGAFKDKKDVDKPYKFVIGLAFNSAAIVRIPLPVIFYEKEFHPNWTYTVGVPKTGLKHILKKKHWLQAEAILDGHFVNIQNNIAIPGANSASAASSITILANLGYQYKFNKDFSVYSFFGRTLWQDGTLRDSNRSGVFALNKEPSFYFRTGFRIGI